MGFSIQKMINFYSYQCRTGGCGHRKAGQKGVRLYATVGNPWKMPGRTKKAFMNGHYLKARVILLIPGSKIFPLEK
jgi:hypothetical protein